MKRKVKPQALCLINGEDRKPIFTYHPSNTHDDARNFHARQAERLQAAIAQERAAKGVSA